MKNNILIESNPMGKLHAQILFFSPYLPLLSLLKKGNCPTYVYYGLSKLDDLALSAKMLLLLPAGSEADFSSSSSTGSLKNREGLVSKSAGKRAPTRRYEVQTSVTSVCWCHFERELYLY